LEDTTQADQTSSHDAYSQLDWGCEMIVETDFMDHWKTTMLIGELDVGRVAPREHSYIPVSGNRKNIRGNQNWGKETERRCNSNVCCPNAGLF
jgi:hypothetical protein